MLFRSGTPRTGAARAPGRAGTRSESRSLALRGVLDGVEEVVQVALETGAVVRLEAAQLVDLVLQAGALLLELGQGGLRKLSSNLEDVFFIVCFSSLTYGFHAK